MKRERERERIFATTISWVAKESKIVANAKPKRAYLSLPPKRSHEYSISLVLFFKKKWNYGLILVNGWTSCKFEWLRDF